MENTAQKDQSVLRDLLNHKELFIFDLDGTLFNTLGDLAPAVNFALGNYGFHPLSNDTLRECIGNGSMNLIRRAIAASANSSSSIITEPGNNAPTKPAFLNLRDQDGVTGVLNSLGYDEEKIVEVHKTYSQYYWEHCTENTVPYEGVLKILSWIKATGNLGTGRKIAAMLTNKPVAPATKILEKFGLFRQFEVILCGDTTPERKPSPAGILEILNRTGVSPAKAVMIGDDTPDILAAQNAGMDQIICLKGFGKPENLLPLQPKYTIGHIQDLASALGVD